MSTNKFNKSVGSYLKESRIKQNISFDQISSETKISISILKNLEEENFEVLGSHVYAKGLIKNYAKFLNLNEDHLIAIFNRDYLDTSHNRVPISTNFTKQFNKRFYSVLLIFAIVSFVTGLMTGLIESSLQPPQLEIIEPFTINAPFEGPVDNTAGKVIILFGKTDESALVTINEEPISLTNGGYFESEPIPLISKNNIINIKAENQLGRTSSILMRISGVEDNVQTQDTSIVITTVTSTYLLIRADGVIVFNDTTGRNETISFEAMDNFEVETEHPSDTIIIYNNEQIRMEQESQRFELDYTLGIRR